MSNAKFCKPGDIITNLATITASAADPDYPATLLHDSDPAHPAKLTSTSGNYVFDFGSAKSIEYVSIIHHNLDAGLAVFIQANTTNSFGSPPLSQAITIPAIREDNFRWNVGLDLTAISHSYRWWRLLFNSANAANIAIGEFLMVQTLRSFPENIQVDFTREIFHPVIVNKTDANVASVFDLGTTWEEITGTVFASDTGATLQESLFRDSSGSAEPFLFIQDPGVTEPLFVRRKTDSLNIRFPWPNRGRQIFQFSVEEVGRGLYL